MPPRRRRGAVILYAVLTFMLLLGFVGLALDTAQVRKTTQELQAAADAAALAAARLVFEDDPATDFLATRQAAVDIALANVAARDACQVESNMANDAAGDVVVGLWDPSSRTFTPDTTAPDAVKVTVRRTADSPGGDVPLLFGPIFGTSSTELARSAIASLGAADDAVVLVLHPTLYGALELKGNAFMDALEGKIQVDSNSDCGIHLNGAPDVPRLRALKTRVVGDFCAPTNSIRTPPVPNSPYVADYLLHLPYPDKATMPDHGSIAGPGTYDPGYYPGGVDFNDGVAQLNPGIYVFGPPGVNVHGDAMLVGDGVMLFIDEGAKFTISGNMPGLDIGAPTSGVYEGISVFQHRANTLPCEVSGGGTFQVGGTMYLANGHLEMDGNVDRHIGRIVIWTQLLRGNGRYFITGEGPPPTGPLYAYLVE